MALAGVMGGLDSEVTDETTDILIESAHFDNINNRRTSLRMNLPSEASSRFTKGVDPSGCLRAADRAAQLMVELAGGTAGGGPRGCLPPAGCPPGYRAAYATGEQPAGLNLSPGADGGAPEPARHGGADPGRFGGRSGRRASPARQGDGEDLAGARSGPPCTRSRRCRRILRSTLAGLMWPGPHWRQAGERLESLRRAATARASSWSWCRAHAGSTSRRGRPGGGDRPVGGLRCHPASSCPAGSPPGADGAPWRRKCSSRPAALADVGPG